LVVGTTRLGAFAKPGICQAKGTFHDTAGFPICAVKIARTQIMGGLAMRRLLFASIAAFSLACGAGFAQSAGGTKQPETGEHPAAGQGGRGEGDQKLEAEKLDKEGQAQPQGAAGTHETGSGGKSGPESPQGDTPSAMQVKPEGSPEQNARGGQTTQ
jgi:hypothetical protein